MRSLTAGETTALGAAVRRNAAKVEIQNGSGTWIDYTAWLESINFGQTIDQPISTATVEFRRDKEPAATNSLSPFIEGSTLNRLDDGLTYSPAIDAGRAIRISVATVAAGSTPGASDYHVVFRGTIDDVDWQASPITVDARDLGAKLADRWVEDVTDYGSAGGTAIETVMQSILTDWLDGETLYSANGTAATPFDPADSPGFLITPYSAGEISVLRALEDLAQLIGWAVRYRWNESVGDFVLTFYEPDRAKSVADFTFGPSRYFGVKRLTISRENVRNAIEVSYRDSITGDRTIIEATDASSITRFGRRWMRLIEGDDSSIDTAAEAQTMADAALADLKDPDAEQDIELPLFWPIELEDFYTFTANGVHYDTDQSWAVVGFRHEISRDRERTSIQVRGSVAGMYRTWLRRVGDELLPDTGKRPTVDLLELETSTRSTAKVQVTGEVGDGGTGPLEYSYRVSDVRNVASAFSDYAALGAGVTLDVTRDPFWPRLLQVKVRDADGRESTVARLPIGQQLLSHDDSDGRVRTIKRGAVIDELTENIFKRGENDAGDVVPSVGRTFIKPSMVDASFRVTKLFRSTIEEASENLFKRGVDTLGDVLDTASRKALPYNGTVAEIPDNVRITTGVVQLTSKVTLRQTLGHISGHAALAFDVTSEDGLNLQTPLILKGPSNLNATAHGADAFGQWDFDTTPTVNGTPIGGGVTSVFGRTGDVVAQSGDYTAAQVGAVPTTDVTETNTASKVVRRNASGDIFMRLVRSEYATITSTPNYVVVQHALGAGADNYHRPATLSQVKTSMGLGRITEGVVTYGSISVSGGTNGYAGIEFTAPTNDIVLMVRESDGLTGMYDRTAGAWKWYWVGTPAVLTAGTVPAARISAGTFQSGDFVVTGKITASAGFFDTSRRDWKDEIEDWALDRDAFMGLRPRTWLWNEKTEHPGQRGFGYVSDEVARFFASPDRKAISHARIGVQTVAMVQDHEREIDRLRARVAELEAARG